MILWLNLCSIQFWIGPHRDPRSRNDHLSLHSRGQSCYDSLMNLNLVDDLIKEADFFFSFGPQDIGKEATTK